LHWVLDITFGEDKAEKNAVTVGPCRLQNAFTIGGTVDAVNINGGVATSNINNINIFCSDP